MTEWVKTQQYMVVSCSLIILCYIFFFGFRAQFTVKFLDRFRLYYRPFD